MPVLTARRSTRCLLALVMLSSAVAVRPALARGDSDPASDVLLVQNVFYPYQPQVSTALQNAMNAALHSASGAGLDLKVAIIGVPEELGLVTYLFGQPQAYAQFLDREISYNHPQPLLVVMPAGFGVANAGSAAPLSSVPVDKTQASYGLTRSAILAVVALARERDPSITAPSIPSDSSPGGQAPALLVFGLPVALIALVALFAMRRRRVHRRQGPA